MYFRENAANIAKELRKQFDLQIFAVAVNPSTDQLSSLSRIVGQEHAKQRLLKLDSVDDFTGEKLSFVKQSLCGKLKTVVVSRTTKSLKRHTIKRDVTHIA